MAKGKISLLLMLIIARFKTYIKTMEGLKLPSGFCAEQRFGK